MSNFKKDAGDSPFDGSSAVVATVVLASPNITPASATLPAPTMVSSTIDNEWHRQFRVLEQYKGATGHTNVPNDGTSLYRWIMQQNRDYTRFVDILEGNNRNNDSVSTTSFNEEKLMLLRSLGFVFRRKLNDPSQKRLDNKREKCDAYIELLKEFRSQFGHVDVPLNVKTSKFSEEDAKKYRGLGQWLSQMRALLRKTKNDPQNEHLYNDILTPDRAQRLDDIGIAVETRVKKRVAQQPAMEGANKRRNQMNDRWDSRFDEIKKFNEHHGHFVVPVKGQYTQLRGWLDKQRKEYKKLQAGFESEELTALRLQRLADIGFEFQARKSLSFDERFEQWVNYRERNDGKDPLRFAGNGLGKWISMIRAKKIALGEGRKNNLTQEQINRLNSKGFVWSVMKRPERRLPRVAWSVRFGDLKKYKEKHGHTSVPQNTPGLGSWVHKQRVKYWDLKRGKTTNNNCDLTPDRIQQLNDLGFEWVSRQRQQHPNSTMPRVRKSNCGEKEDDEDADYDNAPTAGEYQTEDEEGESEDDEDKDNDQEDYEDEDDEDNEVGYYAMPSAAAVAPRQQQQHQQHPIPDQPPQQQQQHQQQPQLYVAAPPSVRAGVTWGQPDRGVYDTSKIATTMALVHASCPVVAGAPATAATAPTNSLHSQISRRAFLANTATQHFW